MLKHLFDKKHQLTIGIVVLVILLAILTKGFTQFKPMSKDAVAKKGLEFMTELVLAQNPNAKITLEKSENYHGLVKTDIDVDGEKIELYISSDAKVAFAQPLLIDKSLALEKYPKAKTADVKLFTMSYCPYGNDAENTVLPVVAALKDAVEIQPHYVIYSNFPSDETEQKNYCWDSEGKYCSMHGLSELRQDVRELCIYKYNKDSFWKYIELVNKDCTNDNIETCWTKPADTLKIDTNKISTCLKDEGLAILAEEKALNDKYSIQASPTLLINEVEFDGDRTSEGYKDAICAGFETQPKACSQKLTADIKGAASGSCN